LWYHNAGRLTRERLDRLVSHGAVTGRVAKHAYLVIALLIILAACQPYTYDANGNPVPHRSSVSATPSWSENCGTQDAPKRCPAYRLRPAKKVSAPLPDYN
jgi:hypothetical protein